MEPDKLWSVQDWSAWETAKPDTIERALRALVERGLIFPTKATLPCKHFLNEEEHKKIEHDWDSLHTILSTVGDEPGWWSVQDLKNSIYSFDRGTNYDILEFLLRLLEQDQQEIKSKMFSGTRHWKYEED